MLGRRRRQWPNIIPTLVQCLVFAGISLKYDQCNLPTPPPPSFRSALFFIDHAFCFSFVLDIKQTRLRLHMQLERYLRAQKKPTPPRGPTARVIYHTCGQGDGIFHPVGLQLMLYTTPVARETVYFTPWAYSSCYIPHLWPGRRYISPRGPTAHVIYHTCGQGDGIFHPVGLQLVLYTTPVARETVYFAPWAYSSCYIPHL